MGIQYYAFALFIAGLICLIAILCKVLFSDTRRQRKLLDEKESNILKLYVSVETLTEEFNDLARTTIEEMKELEVRALSRMSVSELPSEFQKIEQVLDRMPQSVPLDANKMRAVGDFIERTDRMTEDDVAYTPSPPPTTAQVSPVAPTSQNVHQAYAAPKPPAPQRPPAPQKAENGGAVFQKMFDDTVETGPSIPVISGGSGAATPQSRSDIILAMSEEGKDDIQIASELGITRNEVSLVLGLKG